MAAGRTLDLALALLCLVCASAAGQAPTCPGSENAAELEALTKAYFDVFNAHDAAATAGTFSADGPCRGIGVFSKLAGSLRDWDNAASGAAKIQETVGGIFKAVPEIKCNILNLAVDPAARRVTAELRIDLNPTDSILVADIFDFDAQGKITALRAYKG